MLTTRIRPSRVQVATAQAAAALLSRTVCRPSVGAASRPQAGGGISSDDRAMSMGRV